MKIAGVVICVVALGLSLQNSFDGYGVKKGNVHPQVLAQTTTSGGTTSGSNNGGSSSGAVTVITYLKNESSCSKTYQVGGGAYITIFGKRFYAVGNAEGEYILKYDKVNIDCQYGGKSVSCTDCTCPNFWAQKCNYTSRRQVLCILFFP